MSGTASGTGHWWHQTDASAHRGSSFGRWESRGGEEGGQVLVGRGVDTSALQSHRPSALHASFNACFAWGLANSCRIFTIAGSSMDVKVGQPSSLLKNGLYLRRARSRPNSAATLWGGTWSGVAASHLASLHAAQVLAVLFVLEGPRDVVGVDVADFARALHDDG